MIFSIGKHFIDPQQTHLIITCILSPPSLLVRKLYSCSIVPNSNYID